MRAALNKLIEPAGSNIKCSSVPCELYVPFWAKSWWGPASSSRTAWALTPCKNKSWIPSRIVSKKYSHTQDSKIFKAAQCKQRDEASSARTLPTMLSHDVNGNYREKVETESL